MTIRVGINGFGRIGRTVFRAALGRTDITVVHVNELADLKTAAHLLKYDSVHGTLPTTVTSMASGLRVGEQELSFSSERDPQSLPWRDKGVDVVFECSGVFKERSDFEKHLKAGAPKVLVSAPAKGEDLTVVYGVNHDKLQAGHKVVSNGSCTTNCLAPFTKVIHDNFTVESGLMTTVHAYTNDQRILDVGHSDLRRARAAALNMIPTSTGAAKALGLVLPELQGKVDGIAVRVPTANVSLVDVTFRVAKKTSAEEVNSLLETAANGPLKGVLGFSNEPLVSIDYNGSTTSSNIDAPMTKVVDGNLVKILSWYDNETGFSHRMLDIAKLMV